MKDEININFNEIRWLDLLNLRSYDPLKDRSEVYKAILLRQKKSGRTHLVVSPSVFDDGFGCHYEILIEYGEKMSWWRRSEISAAGYDIDFDHKKVVRDFISKKGVEVLGGMTVKGNGSMDFGPIPGEWWLEVQLVLFGKKLQAGAD